MTIKTFKKRLQSLGYMVSVKNKKIIVTPTVFHPKEHKLNVKIVLRKYSFGFLGHVPNSNINHNALKVIMKFDRTPIPERHYEQDFGSLVTLNQLYDIISHHYGNLKITFAHNKIIIKTPSKYNDVHINALKSSDASDFSDLKSNNLRKLIKTFVETPIIYRGYKQYLYNPKVRKSLVQLLKKKSDNEYKNAVKEHRKRTEAHLAKSQKSLWTHNDDRRLPKTLNKPYRNYKGHHYAKTEKMQWTETERNYFAWLRVKGDAEGNKIYGKTDADAAHTLIRETLKMDEDANHIRF